MRKSIRINLFMISLVLVFLLSISSVLAISQPSNIQPIISQSIFGSPTAPNTGSCAPNAIQDYTCNGNVLHYNQCQQTMSENVWQPRTEICSGSCHFGRCLPASISYIMYGMIALVVLLIIIMIVYLSTRRRR